jgi:hypothetical protein
MATKVQHVGTLLAELAAVTAGDAPAVFTCTNGLDAERQALSPRWRSDFHLPSFFFCMENHE